jgi:circadian clock protein KaiB
MRAQTDDVGAQARPVEACAPRRVWTSKTLETSIAAAFTGPLSPAMSDTTLKLYVVRGTPSSERAIAAIEQLRAALPGPVTIDVVDLSAHPEIAEADRVIATPMLVRVAPEPARRIVGDLSDLDRVRWGLGLGAA